MCVYVNVYAYVNVNNCMCVGRTEHTHTHTITSLIKQPYRLTAHMPSLVRVRHLARTEVRVHSHVQRVDLILPGLATVLAVLHDAELFLPLPFFCLVPLLLLLPPLIPCSLVLRLRLLRRFVRPPLPPRLVVGNDAQLIARLLDARAINIFDFAGRRAPVAETLRA